MSGRTPAARTKPKRYRAPKDKPFDPDVEFGGGVKTRGTSEQAHSKKNREGRASLRGPPLAIHRAKEAYRTVKHRALKDGIVTEEMSREVGRPIGTAWDELNIPEQNKFKKLIEDYNAIKLCRRKLMIFTEWRRLSDERKRELLGIGPEDRIPQFRIPPEELEMAWPMRHAFEIRIKRPDGFNPASYTAFTSFGESSLANAASLADETTAYTIDTSDDDETLYSTDSDPLTDIEPVSYYLVILNVKLTS